MSSHVQTASSIMQCNTVFVWIHPGHRRGQYRRKPN